MNLGFGTLAGHRFAYRLFKGDIPEGASVCHKCDTPPCVNPDHLWLGSHADNMADMAKKGRNHHGERTPWAKLTNDAVRHIRLKAMPAKRYADIYKISPAYVYLVQRGKRWSHTAAIRARIAELETPQ